MTCEDCGFEHNENGACPRCGYDPSVDFVAAVRTPNPQLTNPLEAEFAAICKDVDEGKASKAYAQQHWRSINERAKAGNADARHLVARMALSQKDYPTALKILPRLAESGHALAQLDLGKMYQDGLGADPDAFKAVKFFRLAATQGNPIALYLLAGQHQPGGCLAENTAQSNAILRELVAVHPTMFRQNGCNGSCNCNGGLTNKEFATKTASQLSTMIKWAVIALILALVFLIVKSEFM